jgi:hypothetical protein
VATRGLFCWAVSPFRHPKIPLRQGFAGQAFSLRPNGAKENGRGIQCLYRQAMNERMGGSQVESGSQINFLSRHPPSRLCRYGAARGREEKVFWDDDGGSEHVNLKTVS